MKSSKIQSLASLRREMIAVARGERKPPRDAARPSFDSVEALVRLLTPANRRLLAAIRDRKPRSVADLAKLTGRAAPNVTRTLAKLEAVGLVRLTAVGRRRSPRVLVRRITVEIDPTATHDRLKVA